MPRPAVTANVTVSALLILVAAIIEVLAALGVASPHVALEPLGLAFLAAGLLVP